MLKCQIPEQKMNVMKVLPNKHLINSETYEYTCRIYPRMLNDENVQTPDIFTLYKLSLHNPKCALYLDKFIMHQFDVFW